MQIIDLATCALAFAGIGAAGPLRRDEQNRHMRRDSPYKNTTSSSILSPTSSLVIVPLGSTTLPSIIATTTRSSSTKLPKFTPGIISSSITSSRTNQTSDRPEITTLGASSKTDPPSTSFSRLFTLNTNSSAVATATGRRTQSGPVTLVTNTYSAISPTGTSSTFATTSQGSGLNTVVTIVVPSPTTLSSQSSPTSPLGQTSLLSVTPSTIVQVPTVLSPPASATTTVAPSTLAQNLAQALGYNTLFATLNASSACTAGSIACIQSQVATCNSNTLHYDLKSCGTGEACFALPMNTTEGVFVGCANSAAAGKILGSVQAVPTTLTSSSPPISTPTSTTVSTTSTHSVTEIEINATTTTTDLPNTDHSTFITTLHMSFASSETGATTEAPVLTTTLRQTSTEILTITMSTLFPSAPTATKTSSMSSKTELAGGLITIVPLHSSSSDGKERITVTETVTLATATITTTARA